MNYKKIFRSLKLRFIILDALSFIPDKIMLYIQYCIKTGRMLNYKNPKRFTEKLQIYKMKYRNSDMLRCTDKYEVRKYIEEKGFGEYLIPLIGIYNNPEDIGFEQLPNKFVAKTTDGGGGTQVLICKNKKNLSPDRFYKTLKDWLSIRKVKKHIGREWAYLNDYSRRLIVEKLIEDDKNKDLIDYKFYCFHGEPKYCQVIQNRSTKETIDFFDMQWEHQVFYGLNPQHGPAVNPIPEPKMFNLMKDIAFELSKDFPFVRVDLYNLDGKIFFGELTFYPASGYGKFTPDKYDYILGDMFDITSFKN